MADITKKCPGCQVELEIPEEMRGQVLECPECGQKFRLGKTVQHAPQARPAAQHQAPAYNPPQKSISGLGIAALVMGIIACTTCWVPYIGLLGIPIALIGLVLGIIGWIISGVAGKSGVGMPVSGTVVCLIAIIIAYNITMKTNDAMIEVLTDTQEELNNTIAEVSSSVPTSSLELPSNLSIKSDTPKPKPPPEKWFNGFNGVVMDNIQISIDKATLAAPEYKDMFGERKQGTEHYLLIYVTIVNGNQNKKINYTTWRGAMMSWGRDYGTLVDNFGNAYKRIGLSTYQLYGSIKESESIYPRTTIKDILIYELPINGTKYLHLDLPADNVGIADKSFKIEIPSNRIM
jgi:hypothetical protein